MRTILLAGGHATRLWPITKHRAKPLLPLGEGTLLDALLDALEPLSEDVLVSTNALFAHQFEQALRERERTRLVVEEQKSEDEKPGALGALVQLLADVPPDAPLLVAAGDNVYGFELEAFVEAARDNDGPTVAAKALPERSMARQFGVVELGEGSRVAAFHEKPEDPPSNLAATALYYYPEGWRALFDDYATAARASPEPRKMFDAPGRILEWAVHEGRPVHAWTFEEAWYDVGTAEGYFDALKGALGDRYVQGTLEGCKEGPGVYVFGDARATDSTLEQVVLLPGARVTGSTLTRCIVDTGAAVTDVSLTDSLVGPYDQLTGRR